MRFLAIGVSLALVGGIARGQTACPGGVCPIRVDSSAFTRFNGFGQLTGAVNDVIPPSTSAGGMMQLSLPVGACLRC